MKINPPLKVRDKIILLSMHGETMSPGLKGVVTIIQQVVGTDVMYIDWENGRTLALLSDTDAWALDESEPMKESYNSEWLSKNLDIANFDTNILVEFLLKVKESGIVNMFGAAPYLWLGKERIAHQFAYHDFSDEKQEKFDEMLDMANKSQLAMINGVIKILEKENKELSVENINRYLQRYSQKILTHHINVFS